MKTRVFIMCILILLVSLCSMAATKGYRLQWDANSEPDLAGYKIYVGTQPFTGAPADYTPIIPTGEGALATTYDGEITIPDDAITTIYARVTAYDTSGLESDFSNQVSQVYDTRVAPAPPQNLTWFERLIAWIRSLFGWA